MNGATQPNDDSSANIQTVSIRPGVSVLSVLRHLKYKAWYALAEFVDNSLQSYTTHKDELLAIHGSDFQLTVKIDLDSGLLTRLSIKDNAAGIAQADYPRAFRPAAIPPNRSGLSEFGMGMKSAACWFAPIWRVRTSALGEPIERTVVFNIEKIVDDQIEELNITQSPAPTDAHYTEVVLEGLHQNLVGRTLHKVKEHLTDIYRVFLQNGTLKILFNGDPLQYSPPPILQASDYRDKTSAPRLWKKNIDFDFGGGLRVHGFAALMDPAQTSRSGFALFRRNRLIEGSGDEGYRPTAIFGQAGSFRWRRLYGELHLEGFDVSHTKDGFQWDENEEPFINLLRDHLDDDECPLLRQADKYRAKESRAERQSAATEATDRVGEVIEQNLPEALPQVAEAQPAETQLTPLEVRPILAQRDIRIRFREENWLIKIELSDDPAESEWLLVSDQKPAGNERILEIRLNLAHPFMVNFAQTTSDQIEPILRIAAALAVSETLARQSGVKYAGTIRRNVNDLLREALSSLSS